MTGRPERAEQMIQTLSTYYRRTLASDPTGDATLADEIALQQLYLEIEAVRFPERLRTTVELSPLVAGAPGMVQLFPEIEFPPLEVWLTTHRELFTSRRIRAIYDALADQLSAYVVSA